MHGEIKSQLEAVDKTLISLAEKNDKIIALTADMADRIIPNFKKVMKERFLNFGIAEQGMIGAAAGLAKSGFIPFVTTLVVFLSMRACEQIRTDLAYAKSNVKIIGSGGGLAYGTLGATHQGLEDISLMRSIANLVVMAPSDYVETVCAIKAAVKYNGPVYIRLGRGPVQTIYENETIDNFKIGKAIKLRDGDDISLIATGVMVAPTLEAREKLEKENIRASVYSMHTIKPLDTETILEASKSKYGIVTIEDNNIKGGLGEAVSAVVTENIPVRVKSIGIPDIFPILGKPEELYKYYNMDSESIAKASMELVKWKNNNS